MKLNHILKAKGILEEMFDGALKKYKVTYFEACEIAHCFNEIINNGETCTIYEGVRSFFDKQKFTITDDGVGWKISL
mgnify:CR=1 FL=1